MAGTNAAGSATACDKRPGRLPPLRAISPPVLFRSRTLNSSGRREILPAASWLARFCLRRLSKCPIPLPFRSPTDSRSPERTGSRQTSARLLLPVRGQSIALAVKLTTDFTEGNKGNEAPLPAGSSAFAWLRREKSRGEGQEMRRYFANSFLAGSRKPVRYVPLFRLVLVDRESQPMDLGKRDEQLAVAALPPDDCFYRSGRIQIARDGQLFHIADADSTNSDQYVAGFETGFNFCVAFHHAHQNQPVSRGRLKIRDFYLLLIFEPALQAS